TENPTQAWLARQMTEAFPWDTVPRYLLPGRDASYGQSFRDRVQVMGINEIVTAPRSPWQNAYVERIIGSIQRECLDHVVIFDERHLRRTLSSYVQYYHRTRTHLSLDKDCPQTRSISQPTGGKIIAFPEVGGLHHRYERRAALPVLTIKQADPFRTAVPLNNCHAQKDGTPWPMHWHPRRKGNRCSIRLIKSRQSRSPNRFPDRIGF